MGLDGTNYQVTLRDADGNKATEYVNARTPGQAAKAAEASWPGYEAELLTQRKIGECCRCGIVIFEGASHPKEVAPGIMLCGEC